jgi:sugar-specific transcriptional regulator TrmB
MSELEESEIEEALQTLGFTKNDSKVLLTLCKYKILSPADIAKQSGVDRARVYDSLNRLIEKGFIQKEPIKRGANYQVIPVDRIFKVIRDQYKQRIEDTLVLEKIISNLEITQEESEPRVWAINSRSKIRKKIKELIKELWNKAFSSNVQLIIALKYSEILKEEIIKLLNKSITIHSIEGDNVIPFGLLISDNEFLLTTLDQVKEAPEYTSGLWLENGMPKQIIGYEHLFRYFITSQCKLIKLTEKKNQPKMNSKVVLKM